MSRTLKQLEEAVISCRPDEMLEETKRAREAGLAVDEIIKDGLVAGQGGVGDRFVEGTYYLPELLVAGQGVGRPSPIWSPSWRSPKRTKRGNSSWAR